MGYARLCRIVGCSELVVKIETVYRGTEVRIVTKQDQFASGGLADNLTQQLCRANFSVSSRLALKCERQATD